MNDAEVFSLTAVAGDCNGDPLGVILKLSNKTTSELEIYEANLPWGDEVALQLRALDDHGQPLDEIHLVVDPSAEVVRVPAGGSVAGCIGLTRRFRNIREAHKRGDIDVFWSFELRASGGTHGTVAGRVRVAKQPAN